MDFFTSCCKIIINDYVAISSGLIFSFKVLIQFTFNYRVRVVNKAGVSDHSELESESEYSQISDYYQEKVRLATAEQTNFTLGLQDSGLLRQQEEDEEMKREEKVR